MRISLSSTPSRLRNIKNINLYLFKKIFRGRFLYTNICGYFLFCIRSTTHLPFPAGLALLDVLEHPKDNQAHHNDANKPPEKLKKCVIYIFEHTIVMNLQAFAGRHCLDFWKGLSWRSPALLPCLS